jgi:hypothetical protein
LRQNSIALSAFSLLLLLLLLLLKEAPLSPSKGRKDEAATRRSEGCAATGGCSTWSMNLTDLERGGAGAAAVDAATLVWWRCT